VSGSGESYAISSAGIAHTVRDILPCTRAGSRQIALVRVTQKSVICSTQRQDCPYIMRLLFPLLLSQLLTSEENLISM
jgi:hypothetical protein